MEDPLAKCKVCQYLKVRRPDGFFNDGKTRRFLDREGKQWLGLLCPSCNRDRARANMRKLRDKNAKKDKAPV